jgi:hypothetical protein
MQFDPADFGPRVTDLLTNAPLNELGPGKPAEAMRPKLAALTAEGVVAPHGLADRQMAECCLAGLWLRYDFLEESHRISQEIETPTGSYWHGILHRREPDYGNSQYWFRRVGRHPIFEPLALAAYEIAPGADDVPAEAAAMIHKLHWDPFAFVFLCELAAQDHSALQAWCARVQQREWELLFVFCYSHAIGR